MAVINYLAKVLSKNSTYSEEILEFCLKLWISTIVQSICMYLIAKLLFEGRYFFCFFIIFFPMRLMIEGYHCKTFLGCFFVSNLYFITICLASVLTAKYEMLLYIPIIMTAVSAIYLIRFSIKNNIVKLKENTREKVYFVFRLLFLLFVCCYIETELFLCRNVSDVDVLIMAYSYIMVFLLSVINVENK